jgi:hypothetical protein
MSVLTTIAGGALQVGNKPSVSDLIVLVGDEDAQFYKALERKKATAVIHSWITDTIPAPDNTPYAEISAPPVAPNSTKQKTTNACQIFKTTASVSYDQEASAVYGNSTEAAHQQKLAAIKHFKSIEASLVGYKGTPGTAKADVLLPPVDRASNSTAGIMAGLPYYISTVNGASSFNAGGRFGNILAVDSTKDWTGTVSTLTWDMIEEFVAIPYENGATMKTIYIGNELKRSLNNLVNRQWENDKNVNRDVSTINTSVGKVEIKLHRMLSSTFGLGDVMIGGDFDFAKIAILGERKEKVPTQETATIWQLYSSLTLEVANSTAFAMLAGAA